MKKYHFLLTLLCICPTIAFGQLKITPNGKTSVGKSHTLDNGQLKIGNDGITQGLSFYDSQYGGTDFRIFRSGNISYLTRGENLVRSIRMHSSGAVTIGGLTSKSTGYGGALRVYSEGECPFMSFGYHNSDYGTVTASLGYRPLSIVFAGNYINSQGTWNRTFYVYANGEVYSAGFYTASDSILKKNITTIPNALDKILSLRGITFDSKFAEEDNNQDIVTKENLTESDKEGAYQIPSSETIKQINTEKKRKRMGLVAQEVESVVPEVVRTQPNGTKAVAYSELIGLFIEAMKEQQVQIEKQQEQIKQLVKLIDIKSINEKVFEENGIESIPLLLQNTPNPFNQVTEIGYYIPETVNKANIYIYDINGFQQKNISISERGKGAITLQASALQAGIYFYTLICDGKPVDTKQMILTR